MTLAGRAPLAGRATVTGTERYAERHQVGPHLVARGQFRPAFGVAVSSVGFGTSAGEATDAVDAAYRAAVQEAVRAGCNLLDTAVSYRAQRSEIALGQALADLVAARECQRDELIVMSKGGYIAYYLQRPANPGQYVYDNFVRAGIAEPDDFAGGIHCMAPGFLAQQVVWSLRNLGLRSLDVYFIQNPEMQLAFVDRTTFRKRVQLAFGALEEEVAAGRLGGYGVATWEGLRSAPVSPGYISLEVLVRLAEEVAGPNHHLRAVQLPISAVMPEAQTLRNQPVRNGILSALNAAHDLGLAVIGSAALGQGCLTERHAALLNEAFPALEGAAPRALQFARSLPHVTAVLFGSLQPAHIRQNLGVAGVAPEPEAALRLAQALAR